MVAEVRPFVRGLVNPTQYHDVLHDWLTPAPEGVEVEWYPSATNAARGIIAITIPAQRRDRWPCIVGKVIDEGGKRRGVAVSYVERHGEHAVSGPRRTSSASCARGREPTPSRTNSMR